MLTMLPEENPGELVAVRLLEDLMERPQPDPKASGAQARKVGDMLRQWEQRLEQTKPEGNLHRDVLERLGLVGPPTEPASWELARQLVLFACLLEDARINNRNEQGAARQGEHPRATIL